MTNLEHVINYLEQSTNERIVEKSQSLQKDKNFKGIVDLILNDDVEYSDFIDILKDSGENEEENLVRNYFIQNSSNKTSDAAFYSVLKSHNHVFCHAFLASLEI